MSKQQTITLHASDVSGQKHVKAGNVPVDSTVGELIDGLLAKMELPRNDANGAELTYHALLDRESRHLQGDETVSAALQDEDRIVLQPNIDAG